MVITQAKNHYHVPKLNKKWLYRNNFKHSEYFSKNSPESFYQLLFPVYRYGDIVCLYGRITLNFDDNKAVIDVVDQAMSYYAPYYSAEYGDYNILLKKIVNQINSKINSLGLVLDKEDNRNNIFDTEIIGD